jgi:hypothetical protein
MKDERNEPQNTGGNVFSFPFRTRSDGVTYPDLDDGKEVTRSSVKEIDETAETGPITLEVRMIIT